MVRKSRPGSRTIPTRECHVSTFWRREVPHFFRAHHRYVPTMASAPIQEAASSEYQRPALPNQRLRCPSDSHVRSGSARAEPYWTRSPRTLASPGSMKTARE